MENNARFVSILRRHVSLKTLMGVSTIFVKELSIATQILLYYHLNVDSANVTENIVFTTIP